MDSLGPGQPDTRLFVFLSQRMIPERDQRSISQRDVPLARPDSLEILLRRSRCRLPRVRQPRDTVRYQVYAE